MCKVNRAILKDRYLVKRRMGPFFQFHARQYFSILKDWLKKNCVSALCFHSLAHKWALVARGHRLLSYQWSIAVHFLLDLNEFDESKGASLKGGINPKTGKPYTLTEARGLVKANGSDRRCCLSTLGFPPSPERFLGREVKNRNVLQNRWGFWDASLRACLYWSF